MPLVLSFSIRASQPTGETRKDRCLRGRAKAPCPTCGLGSTCGASLTPLTRCTPRLRPPSGPVTTHATFPRWEATRFPAPPRLDVHGATAVGPPSSEAYSLVKPADGIAGSVVGAGRTEIRGGRFVALTLVPQAVIVNLPGPLPSEGGRRSRATGSSCRNARSTRSGRTRPRRARPRTARGRCPRCTGRGIASRSPAVPPLHGSLRDAS